MASPRISKTSFLLLSALSLGALAYTEPPPTTAASDTIQDCTNWVVVKSTDTCASIASANGITVAQFNKYNPSTTNGCKLVSGNSYCVEENYGIPPATSTTTTSTSPSNGVSTPTPTQSGMTSSCAKFYQVKSGDTCFDISNTYGIALSDFYSWNPAVGNNCGGLQPNYYVCVGLIGATSTKTTSSATTTKPNNGITTPTPTQSGMVSNCNKFYLVQSGDGCQAIATKYSIPLSTFYNWNPAVKTDCTGLQAGYNVCVGTTTFTTTTTKSTTTSAGNGISTPTPTQSGMVSNCNKFYLVKSGDGCQAIADKFSIPLAKFYSWNPAVKTDCTGLQAGYNVCVDTTTYTPTTTKPTTTSAGNGVTTPTPTQTGMTKNCHKFYKVVSGDKCANIASKFGITLSNFYKWNPAVKSDCSALWVGYYVCVGL